MKLNFEKCRQVKSPTKAHSTDAGIDFFVPYDYNNEQEYLLRPGERVSIPAGVRVDIPRGYALVAHNKSGVAMNLGLAVMACVCDSGYMGEVHLSLANVGRDDVFIKPGMKLSQFLLLPVPDVELQEVMTGTLFIKGGTLRGAGGFGSTGDK